MKQLIGKPKKAFLLAICGFCMFILSSSAPYGGDSFEIYLNQKLVIQQALHADKSVKELSLQTNNYNDQLKVSFSHCGKIGEGRSLALKGKDNRVVKQWKFADGTSSSRYMSFSVKELIDVQKANAAEKLNLVYSSKELPKGYILASVNIGKMAVAKL